MKWRDKINSRYLLVSLYVIITVVIIYALKLIMDNASEIMHQFLESVRWILRVTKPIVLGFVFAYLMDPVVNFLERRYRGLKEVKFFRRFVMPRTWAAITAVAFLVIIVLGLISLLVFTVTNQIRLANLDDILRLVQGSVKSIQDFGNSVLAKLDEFDIRSLEIKEYIETASKFIINSMISFVQNSVGTVTNISSFLTTFIFGFIIGIYFMIDGRMFVSYIRKICLALFRDNVVKRLQGIVNDLDRVFSGYIRGQLLDALVMMVLISIVLSITGVKFALVIGILAGIGNLIPYFGPVIAYASTTLVCLISGDVKTWVISMIALLLIQFIDGNMIGPKLLSSSIQIHPLIIIVSLIFGSAVGGFLGMLLAVPLGAYVKLVFVRFIEHRIEQKTKKEETDGV